MAVESAEAHAVIAKHMVLEAPLRADRRFGPADYARALVYCNHLDTDLSRLSPDDPEAARWLVRYLYALGRYQRRPNYILGRYWILLTRLGSKSDAMSAMVREATGLDLREAILIAIGFLSLALGHGYVSADGLIGHNIPALGDVLGADKVGRFLSLISASPHAFRQSLRPYATSDRLLAKYEYNPLWAYPIIDTGLDHPTHRYLIPSMGDLLFRCTEGVYYSAMAHYRGQGTAENLFSEKFGYLFEEYIGCLLEYVGKSNHRLGQVRREFAYGDKRGKEARSADWLLLNEREVTQVECKKFHTSNKFRLGISDGSEDDFEATLKRLAGHVAKLAKKAADIAAGRVPDIRAPSDGIVSVVLTLDEMYFVDSRLKQRIAALAMQCSQYMSEDFRFHVLGATDFEILCEFLRSHPTLSMGSVLLGKGRDSGYEAPIGDYLERTYGFRCLDMPLIEAASREVWGSIGFSSEAIGAG